jgi:hypothetical protein
MLEINEYRTTTAILTRALFNQCVAMAEYQKMPTNMAFELAEKAMQIAKAELQK